jgi:hypothetical protein
MHDWQATSLSCLASVVERYTTPHVVKLCSLLDQGELTSIIDLAAGVLAEPPSGQDQSMWVQLAPMLVRDEGLMADDFADGAVDSHSAFIALGLLLLCLIVPITVAASSNHEGGLIGRSAWTASIASQVHRIVQILPPSVQSRLHAGYLAAQRVHQAALSVAASMVPTSRVHWLAPGSSILPVAETAEISISPRASQDDDTSFDEVLGRS